MPTPSETFKKLDPELFKLVNETRKFAFETDGAIPPKYKYLIAMAMDIGNGAVHSVRGLAKSAIAAGATREEISEAVRIANYIKSASILNVAGKALEGLF
ncbi:MAG: carboxymuconolactone decarboxylase family protein, partial [Dehalococcoidales bacterium]|jgi:alkylhydroperoxidase/carboxymuconolactone decarboxylase family protein YurZ